MPQRVFEPIYPNPFIAGNPIRTKEMFFGRMDEFRFIARALEGGRKTALIVLFGERRSGKSSILYQILNGELGEAFLPIFVDMQIMAGITSDAEFFGRMIADACATLNKNGLSSDFYLSLLKETTSTNVFRKFLQDLKARFPQRAVLLLIDEYEILEAKINEGCLSRNVLAFFAGLLETELVSFVFTGSKSLEARDRMLWGEELFRKAMARKISFLTEDDTARLITQPLQHKVTFAPEVIKQIYALTAGQPFYTQMICQNLVYHLNEVEKYLVESADLQTVVDGVIENPPPQLLFNWSEHTPGRKLTLALLAEFSEKPETFLSARDLCHGIKRHKLQLTLDVNFLNTELSTLHQEEYVVQKGRKYGFRLDLYRRWVQHDHSIWQVKKEVGEKEIARITKQADVKKEKKQRALKILERVGEAALAVAVIYLIAWVIFERKRSVIIKANGGPFDVWVDGEKYGTTKGQLDSTQFEILDGLTLIKNYMLTLGSARNKDYKFRSGLTRDQEYQFTIVLGSGQKVPRSETVKKDGQVLQFKFDSHPVKVITDAELAQIQLGGDSTQIKGNKTEWWWREFNVCAGTYRLRAEDLGTGEVKLDTVTVPATSNVRVDFDRVVMATFAAKDSFTCAYSRANVQTEKRSVPSARADSSRIVLRGLLKGSHRFAFTNLRTQQDTTVQILARADTTILLKFDPNYHKRRRNGRETVVTETTQPSTEALLPEYRLSFVSAPPSAGVYFNGLHCNNTPFDTALATGNYSFTFKKAGYDSTLKPIKLTKDDTMSVKLIGQYGTLKLLVQDEETGDYLSNVQILIDNEPKGETGGPVKHIPSLLATEHRLRLIRGLYIHADTSFAIAKNDTFEFLIKMRKRR